MSPSTRRQVLQYSSIGLGIGLAGCSALGLSSNTPESSGQRVGALGVTNETPEPVTVSVVIIRDGEELYWNTHELAGTDATGDRSASIHLTPPTFTGGQGNYTIGVRMEDTGTSAMLDLGEMAESAPDEDGCYFVLASLTEDGPVFGQGTSDKQTNCPG